MGKRRLLWLLVALPVLGGVFFGGSIALAVQLENRNSFCASCHTEPESTYYNRSLETPTDLATAHTQAEFSIRCIDCHSGEGMKGRAASLQQGANDLWAYISGNFAQPATTHNPVGDVGCTKCHAPNLADNQSSPGIASQSHYHLASYLNAWGFRDPQALGTCVACHAAHTPGSSASDHFTSGSNDACEDCHRDLSGWEPPS